MRRYGYKNRDRRRLRQTGCFNDPAGSCSSVLLLSVFAVKRKPVTARSKTCPTQGYTTLARRAERKCRQFHGKTPCFRRIIGRPNDAVCPCDRRRAAADFDGGPSGHWAARRIGPLAVSDVDQSLSEPRKAGAPAFRIPARFRAEKCKTHQPHGRKPCKNERPRRNTPSPQAQPGKEKATSLRRHRR